MKNAIIGILIGLLLFAGGFVSLKYAHLKNDYKSMVTYCDSLKIVANKPPITTIKDTVIYRNVIKWQTKFDTIVDFTQMKVYKDSLINDSINLRAVIYANELYSIDYEYKPILFTKTITIEKNVPYPVIKECPEIPKSKLISLYAGLTTQLMPAINVGYKKINVSLTYSNGKPLGIVMYNFR